MANRPVRISNELEEVRNLFNSNLSRQLGLERFPKNKTDDILAEAIKESNILNMNVNIKKDNRRGKIFDIQF